MPTTFRIVATLEELGYIERQADGTVHPGLAVLTLGSAALRGSGLVQTADRPLRRLAEATGETVNLGVLNHDRVLYLARLRNADLVTANVDVESTLPAPFTSMGKLLLAYLDEDDLHARIGPESFPPGSGPNATESLATLTTELAVICEQGFAIQDEELAQGLRSVSTPILDASRRPVAAINVAVSSSRRSVDDLRHQILPQLRVTSDEISTRLGQR